MIMQHTINRKWLTVIGIVFILPTAYFIFISILKYGLGIPGLFNLSQPVLENLGINESLGLNINLLIITGPVIALLLNLFAILKLDWYNENETVSISISIQKKWWNVAVIVLSAILVLTLFIYALGENCRC